MKTAYFLINAYITFGLAFTLHAGTLLERVGSGFVNPIYVTAPSDSVNVFIAEQGGLVKSLNPESGVSQTFIDLSSSIASGGERGLLGLEFAPDYASTNRLYVNYTNLSGDTVISRIVKTVSSFTEEVLLTINQPFSNHNGGWIGFGPDGHLYIATGDGGAGNDPQNNSQNTASLLGKMLRIDVSGSSGYTIPMGNPYNNEIFAIGLRNPWRASFDRVTGDLYIGDVGQGAREEISYLAAGTGAGSNFGWRLREGTIATPGVGGPLPGAIDPIYDYLHGSGSLEGFSVTGGYAYRGSCVSLQGKYIFADYINPQIWSIDNTTGANITNITSDFTIIGGGSLNSISSFGEDSKGELYLVDHDGDIFRVGPVESSSKFRDFNGDGNVDILWRNSVTNQTSVHYHDDILRLEVKNTSHFVGGSWRVAGVGDFDGDSKADILWRNTNDGRIVLHYMDGEQLLGGGATTQHVGLNWKIAGVGDMDADNKADIIWRNINDGRTVIHYMDGQTFLFAELSPVQIGLNWELVAIADFNGDNGTDFVWRRIDNGIVVIHFLVGVDLLESLQTDFRVGIKWTLIGADDFNGDGNADILWRRMSDGISVIHYMNENTYVDRGVLSDQMSTDWNPSLR